MQMIWHYDEREGFNMAGFVLMTERIDNGPPTGKSFKEWPSIVRACRHMVNLIRNAPPPFAKV